MRNEKDTAVSNYAMIVFVILLGLLFTFVDYKYPLNDLLTFLDSQILIEISDIMLQSIMAFAAVWITCYLLLGQVFKDRYTLKNVEEKQMKPMKAQIINIVISVIFGVMILVIHKGVLAPLFYIIFTIYTIINILFTACETVKSMMTNTYIDKLFSDLNDSIKKSDAESFAKLIPDIAKSCEESVLKEEYCVVENVIEKTGESFKLFFENDNDSEDDNKIFELFVDFDIELVRFCRDIKSDSLIQKIIRSNADNLALAAESGKEKRFDRYMVGYSRNIVWTIRTNHGEDIASYKSRLYGMIYYLAKKMMEADNPVYFKRTLDHLLAVLQSLNDSQERVYFDGYVRALTNIVIECIDAGETKNAYFDVAYKNTFIPMSKALLRKDIQFEKIRDFYRTLFQAVLEKDFLLGIDFYERIFKAEHLLSRDIYYLSFKQYMIETMFREATKDNAEVNEKLLYFRAALLFEGLSNNYNYKLYLLEGVEEMLNNGSISYEKVKYFTFRSLLECAEKENFQSFGGILAQLNKIISEAYKDNALKQKEFFEIYLDLLFERDITRNDKFLNELMYFMHQLILNGISDNCLGYVISVLGDISKDVNITSGQVKKEIIMTLREILKKGDVITEDLEKQIYKSIYIAGESCIENDCEEVLRWVSNYYGWFIVDNLRKQKRSEALINYLFDRAFELYNIAKAMQVSEKTIIFYLTLFTSVGMYCCMNDENRPYLDRIYSGLMDEDINRIKLALSIRTGENDEFEMLLEGKSQILKEYFLYGLESQK